MKITFIGPISPPTTGPGVKNKLLVNCILDKFDVKVTVVDTFNARIKLLARVYNIISNNNDIILSVSTYGRYVYIPLVYFKNKFLKINSVLLPAGGNFAKEINSLPYLVKPLFLKMVNSFSKVCPETYLLEEELKKAGLNNVEVLPNPRIKFDGKRKIFEENEVQLYFISSIKKSKGIINCIEAVEKLNKKGFNCALNIYGRIQNEFRKEFENKISDHSKINYLGMLDNNKVTKTLAEKSDILLLPTYYFGEGLPGILVEAAFAGVPIVITKFKGAESYFIDRENALFVKPNNSDDLSEKIEDLIHDTSLRNTISENLVELSDDFEVEKVTNRLLKYIS